MDEETRKTYEAMSAEQLMDAIGEAYQAKELGLMKELLKMHGAKEREEEKVAKEALQAKLQETVQIVAKAINKVVDGLIEDGTLDGADGVWYSQDFGEKKEKGINPACRVTKGRKSTGGGGGGGSSSYVANPAKSADLLAQVGDNVYIKEDTTATIDKVETTLPAGMTFNEAWALSTNGGWRNRVRMALLKEAGIV